jgi:hypothetical protein
MHYKVYCIFRTEDRGGMFLEDDGYLPTRPRSVTTQKTNIDIYTAAIT